ncbi:phosphopantetheine-binding protein [Anaerosporobacter sp.]
MNNKISDYVIKSIVKVKAELSLADISLMSSFEEMGIDSIEFVKILLDLEEEFDIEFEEEYMLSTTYNNVEGLVQYIESVIENE